MAKEKAPRLRRKRRAKPGEGGVLTRYPATTLTAEDMRNQLEYLSFWK